MKKSVLTKASFLGLFLALATSGLVACQNKDSNFASKYVKSPAGASAVSAESAAIAAQMANATGNDIDVVAFDGAYAGSNGAAIVNSVVVVNNAQFTLTTILPSNGAGGFAAQASKVSVGGLDFDVNAMCSGSKCQSYYLMITVKKAGQFIIQEGFKKALPVSAGTSSDVYQFLDQSNQMNFDSMVNLLNSVKL